MKLKVVPIDKVVDYQLCCGCGACAYVSPELYTMTDVPELGKRPLVKGDAPSDPKDDPAARVCPGARLAHTFSRSGKDLQSELIAGWGPVLEVWEGHAADPAVRFGGSSGGVITAMALFCIEKRGMYGALHTGAQKLAPHLNTTVLSRSRKELMDAAGSRYSPASPCDGLRQIESAPSPCVFIGKPCDVAAVRNVQALRPAFDRNVGLAIAFFCAGTPSTNGTIALLRQAGVADPATITGLRYRGDGWPGRWTVQWSAAEGPREASLSYSESWGFLQKHRQWRCYICPDHTGEFADISVGDPWDRPAREGEAGSSLVIARTDRGRAMLLEATNAGYLCLERIAIARLPAAQPNLLKTRGALWGRMLALRLLGAPRPRYRGFPLLGFWISKLSIREKCSSILGTIKRVYSKQLKRRLCVARRNQDKVAR